MAEGEHGVSVIERTFSAESKDSIVEFARRAGVDSDSKAVCYFDGWCPDEEVPEEEYRDFLSSLKAFVVVVHGEDGQIVEALVINNPGAVAKGRKRYYVDISDPTGENNRYWKASEGRMVYDETEGMNHAIMGLVGQGEPSDSYSGCFLPVSHLLESTDTRYTGTSVYNSPKVRATDRIDPSTTQGTFSNVNAGNYISAVFFK